MVCSPHQYTLTRMAMPVYQARQDTISYAPSQLLRLYQGNNVFQSSYTATTLPQVNYNFSSTTQDSSLFPLVFQSSSHLPEEKKEESPLTQMELSYTPQIVSPQFNSGLYSLPITYGSQQSTLIENQAQLKMRNDLPQLIQRELAELQVQVQHV